MANSLRTGQSLRTRGQTSRDGLRTARCQTSRGTGSREALLPLLAFHVDGVQGIQHVALEFPQSLRFSLHQQQLDRGLCGVVPCNNQPRAHRGTATIASIEAMKQSVHGPIEDDRSRCVVPQLPTQQLPRAQPHLLWTLWGLPRDTAANTFANAFTNRRCYTHTHTHLHRHLYTQALLHSTSNSAGPWFIFIDWPTQFLIPETVWASHKYMEKKLQADVQLLEPLD